MQNIAAENVTGCWEITLAIDARAVAPVRCSKYSTDAWATKLKQKHKLQTYMLAAI